MEDGVVVCARAAAQRERGRDGGDGGGRARARGHKPPLFTREQGKEYRVTSTGEAPVLANHYLGNIWY